MCDSNNHRIQVFDLDLNFTSEITSLLLRPDIVRFRVKKGAGKPKFSDVFCGPYHTFVATQRGEVYVWGLNNYGQLCTGDSKNRYQPELLEGGLIGGRGLGVAKDFCVASGGHHTVVCCDGEVFTCGRKEYGRLGLGKDTEEPNLPTQVEGLKWVKVVTVAVGGVCSFVEEDGEQENSGCVSWWSAHSSSGLTEMIADWGWREVLYTHSILSCTHNT